ncbi:MAG: hypothetical protein ACLGI2_07975 [Acidimicrobiia bacterium]
MLVADEATAADAICPAMTRPATYEIVDDRSGKRPVMHTAEGPRWRAVVVDSQDDDA